MRELGRFLKDEGGQTAVVEAILIVLIMAAIIVTLFPQLGTAIRDGVNAVVNYIRWAIGWKPT